MSRLDRSGFPSEDNLPKEPKALHELLQAAVAAKLSFRYTNVIRHRIMDAVMAKIEKGEL